MGGLQDGQDMQRKLQSNASSSNTDDQMKGAQVWDGIITDKLYPRKTDLNGQLQNRHVYSKK